MALTTQQLRDGIRYWREERPRWNQDFHNAFYRDKLPGVQPINGAFDQVWWGRMWSLLQDWSATRRGGGRDAMSQRAHDRFEGLGEAWALAVSPHLDDDIEGLQWRQVAALPALAAQIKAVRSPVFTSKFCHFLAPRIFPIVDNAAMGNPYATYQEYFTSARAEWLDTDGTTREDLAALLTQEVRDPVFARFPMKCKLVELCLIGRHQARKRNRRRHDVCELRWVEDLGRERSAW